MKKVVWPESPYGVWTTRSSPSPPARARETSSAYVVAVPIVLGTLGTPASLPSRVVSIFESSRWRASSGPPGSVRTERWSGAGGAVRPVAGSASGRPQRGPRPRPPTRARPRSPAPSADQRAGLGRLDHAAKRTPASFAGHVVDV